MKFEKKYIATPILWIWVMAFIILVAIIGRAIYTSTVDAEKWKGLGEVQVGDTLVLPAARGNILSADGQLMASSLPNYKVHIDYLSGGVKVGDSINYELKAVKDSIFLANVDSISVGMARICDARTAEEYREHLIEGLEKGSRYWDIFPNTILNYVQYHELLKLPIFREKNRNVSGLSVEERNNRKKPFGSLAKRTLGELYGTEDTTRSIARSGLELAYDSLLRGEKGMHHKKKVLKKYVDIIDKEPVDGYDLVSTIDVSLQDICESALKEKLFELNASMGVVVLMEVQTGDVKAIVNLQRYDDGNYYEARNYALAALMEPGSTFKTASIMVAMDDGYVSIKDQVNTGNGVCNMYGSKMKDHNWASHGGYGVIDVPHVLMYSSNIGVSKLIDGHYHNQPEKFVEGLRRVGIGTPLGLPFQGAADPVIRMPNEKRTNWSNTALAWMSIGYETQIPPISTVAFYNAIANNGKMVRPRFARGIQRDGEMVEEFPVEVIRESICKPSTLKDIQTILYRVVNDKEGLGKRAGNKYFHVSGKTGTAQVAGKGGYKGGRCEHLVSFCGYYPSEEPKYTCIVAIRHDYYVASGGGQAGTVFSKIAQRVYSKDITTDLNRAIDMEASNVPDVKCGDVAAAQSVLSALNVGSVAVSSTWGDAMIESDQVKWNEKVFDDKTVPDLTGMGARDAVYVLESRGQNVRIKGRGKVKKQSVAPGGPFVNGQTIVLELEP